MYSITLLAGKTNDQVIPI